MITIAFMLIGLFLGVVTGVTLYRVYFTDPMDMYTAEERLQRKYDAEYTWWVCTGEVPPKDADR